MLLSEHTKGQTVCSPFPENHRRRPRLRPIQALAFCGPRWSEAPELGQQPRREAGPAGTDTAGYAGCRGQDVSAAPAGFLSTMISLTHKGGERQSLIV